MGCAKYAILSSPVFTRLKHGIRIAMLDVFFAWLSGLVAVKFVGHHWQMREDTERLQRD